MFDLSGITGALVSLVVGSLLGKEISRFVYRPRVIIQYRDIMPLHTEDGYFWSIEVANLGRTVATNCHGTITLFDVNAEDLMEVHEADKQESLPTYREEKLDLGYPRFQLIAPRKFRKTRNSLLCWAQLGNPHSININPGMVQKLDVCKVQIKEKDNSYLIFPSEYGWRKVRLRIKADGLKGRILICPSNEYPTPIDFEISKDREGNPAFVLNKIKVGSRLRQFFFRRKFYFD